MLFFWTSWKVFSWPVLLSYQVSYSIACLSCFSSILNVILGVIYGVVSKRSISYWLTLWTNVMAHVFWQWASSPLCFCVAVGSALLGCKWKAGHVTMSFRDGPQAYPNAWMLLSSFFMCMCGICAEREERLKAQTLTRGEIKKAIEYSADRFNAVVLKRFISKCNADTVKLELSQWHVVKLWNLFVGTLESEESFQFSSVRLSGSVPDVLALQCTARHVRASITHGRSQI